MNPFLRKLLLYFIVVASSAIIMAWLVLPFVIFYRPGQLQFIFIRVFALIGYFGLGYWLYNKYFPIIRERAEKSGFFKF